MPSCPFCQDGIIYDHHDSRTFESTCQTCDGLGEVEKKWRERRQIACITCKGDGAHIEQIRTETADRIILTGVRKKCDYCKGWGVRTSWQTYCLPKKSAKNPEPKIIPKHPTTYNEKTLKIAEFKPMCPHCFGWGSELEHYYKGDQLIVRTVGKCRSCQGTKEVPRVWRELREIPCPRCREKRAITLIDRRESAKRNNPPLPFQLDFSIPHFGSSSDLLVHQETKLRCGFCQGRGRLEVWIICWEID